MDKEALRVEFFKQYMEEIASVEDLSIEDCEHAWQVNMPYISSFDDVDRVIEQLKGE